MTPVPMTDKPWQREQSLLIALGAMPVGVSWATLSDQKIVYMNQMFTEIFGYVVGDFEDIAHWIGKYPNASDRTLAAGRWGKYFEAPDGMDYPIEPMELSIRCKDGTIKTILHSGIILPQAGWALATFIDISERKRDEVRLREAEKRAAENQAIYRTLLDHSQEMIVLSSFDGLRQYVSPAVVQITGWTPEEYLSRPTYSRIHPDDLEMGKETIRQIESGAPAVTQRYRAPRKDGTYCWVEALVRAYIDPDSLLPAGYVATIRDISELKRQEELIALEHRRLTEYASQDELTGIPNRRMFNQTLEREVHRQSRSTLATALLMLDVDKFKEYNDHYGHLPGDSCLQQVAATLSNSLQRLADIVARYGGEEFVMLLPMTDRAGAEHVARLTLEAIRSLGIPHAYSPAGILTVSIGVACWPAGLPINAETLLQQADVALYRAKSAGRNTYCVVECEGGGPGLAAPIDKVQ